jgi:cytochrome b pre-mRNA-processing protein 3
MEEVTGLILGPGGPKDRPEVPGTMPSTHRQVKPVGDVRAVAHLPPRTCAMFRLPGRPPPHRDAAERLYVAMATQARHPAFFAELGVPDTVNGRFDVLALHAWMVIDRLREEPEGDVLAQALFDSMFGHLDAAVREMGAQDLGVGRRIKVMAEGLHGRALAFRAAMSDSNPAVLENTLQRNVFGAVTPGRTAIVRLAGYVRASVAALTMLPAARLRDGSIAWPAV